MTAVEDPDIIACYSVDGHKLVVKRLCMDRRRHRAMLCLFLGTLPREDRASRFHEPFRRISTGIPRSVISHCKRYAQEIEPIVVGICLANQPQRIIAAAEVLRYNGDVDHAEFAVAVGAGYKGRGLGGLVSYAALTACGQCEWPIRRLFATANLENGPAVKIAERCGFSRQRRLAGQDADEVRFAANIDDPAVVEFMETCPASLLEGRREKRVVAVGSAQRFALQ